MTARESRPLLVVARYREDLSWLTQVPESFDIVVYNKGPSLADTLPRLRAHSLEVMDRPNVGRESETILHHLMTRYGSHPEWTYFLQGHPFDHGADVISLLSKPPLVPLCAPLSRCWCGQGKALQVPPADLLEDYMLTHNKVTRVEPISTQSLNTLSSNDAGADAILRDYLRAHRLRHGVNVLHHFYGLLGLNDWIPKNAERISFIYGAMMAVSRAAIQQHALQVYARLLEQCLYYSGCGYVIERAWYGFFDPAAALGPVNLSRLY